MNMAEEVPGVKEPQREQRPFIWMIAASDNGVIGVDNQLPWRLSRDLQQFKRLTMGHHLIMGRKTFESIGRVLPGRTTIVITRNRNWRHPGVSSAHDMDQLLHTVSGDPEPFVVGGAEIYKWLLPWTRRIYLTRVHVNLTGDAFMPMVNWDDWQLKHSEDWPADERNQYPASFELWEPHGGTFAE